jgi:hypothetical protein
MGHHRERAKAGAGHGERIGAGVEAGNMQTPGAHRLDLRGVGLYGEEQHWLARDLRQVIEEPLPNLGVDGRILDRRVGEDQGRRIDLFGLVRRNIRDHVAVVVWIAAVELEVGCGREAHACRDGQRHQQRHETWFHVTLLASF